MMLVSCGTDLKFHNSTSYELAHVYRPADSSGQIRNVSWCKDGSWLIMVPNRGNAEIIRTKNDVRLLQTVLGVAQPTSAVFQRTTKRNVAMGTANGTVLLYDIKAKTTKKRFVTTGSIVTLLDWNLKDSHLAIGCADNQITLYSNTTNQKSSVITVPNSKSVSALRFHKTSRSILSAASDEGIVAIWDITSGKIKMCINSHKAPVTDLVFSSQNNKLLVSVGLDRIYQCYDINSGHVVSSVLTDQPLSAVDLEPDGFSIAAASTRGVIYIYDLRKLDKPSKCIAAHSGEIKKVSYEPHAMETTEDFFISIPEENHPIELETKSSNVTDDSFANMLICNTTEFTTTEPEPAKQETVRSKMDSAGGDSFLNGLENSFFKTDNSIKDKSELSNLKVFDGVRAWIGSKDSLNEPSPILGENMTTGKPSDVTKFSILYSTPEREAANKSTVKAADTNISPVVTISREELQEMIENVVKEVVNEKISDLSDIWRNNVLNILMVFSKQFVNLDTHIEQLFQQYSSASNSHQSRQIRQLQEENDFLRNKIDELFKKNASK